MRLLRWVGVALLIACVIAPAAQAERAFLGSDHIKVQKAPTDPVEDPCGIAAIGGLLYLSDYYHHAIDVFSRSTGAYLSQIPFDPLDGPCALAAGPGGELYANDFHQGISRVLPTPLLFDEAESTGVAVGEDGRVYANDRTYVAAYEPSGQAVMDGGVPLKIGEGSLLDGYGVAVFGGRVYVPDAGDRTVKVFEPAIDPDQPSAVIAPPGGFHSLVDAALAIDPTNGHLLVIDNLQPGFEHPEAAIDEFDSTGVFLDQLSQRLIDGEPSGIAFDQEEKLYVTSGNSEESAVLEFGPYVESGGLEQDGGGEPAQAVDAGVVASPSEETTQAPQSAVPLRAETAKQAKHHPRHHKARKHKPHRKGRHGTR